MKTKLLSVAMTAALATACSSLPPQSSALEEARSSYQTAAADPQVIQSAPLELSRAQASLQRAEVAWQNKDDAAQIDHLSYLAKQQALIASERGKLAAAQKTLENADVQRNQVLLDARQQALMAEQQRTQKAQSRAQAAEDTASTQAQQNAELQKQLQDMAAKQTPMGMVMTLGDVLFDVGKAALKPGAHRSLDRLADFMKNYPQRKLRVEGFTDSTGSAELNTVLSQRRAEVVRDQLVQRGIGGERIQATGYGPAFPVASNDTAAGRQQNRRVEIVISDEKGNVPTR